MCSKVYHTLIVILILSTVTIKSCPVHIRIYPAGRTSYEANIQITWDSDCDPQPNWIKVYNSDPSTSDPLPKVVIDPRSYPSKEYVLPQRLGKFSLPGRWNRPEQEAPNAKRKSYPGGRCLMYYAASFYNDELLSVDCLKIQPNWMRLNEHVADVPVRNLFIPGTRASGCYYNITKRGSIKMEKFYHTQNFDIWTQLVFGVRFLDLNIGFKNDSMQDFWSVFDEAYVTPLIKIINDIKVFVKVSGEVVLLDFNGFGLGFEESGVQHRILIDLLEFELGDIVYRRPATINDQKKSYDLTVKEILKAGKNILMMYRLELLEKSAIVSDLVWPSWKRFSTENLHETHILDQMRMLFAGKNMSLAGHQGSILYAIKGYDGINIKSSTKFPTTRERALSINSKLQKLLSGPWGTRANVVATDFVMSTNLIELAITTNRFKAYQMINNFTSFTII